MKKTSIILLFLFAKHLLFSQKEGNIWLFDGGLRDNDPPDSLSATVKFNFNHSPMTREYIYEFPGLHVATSMVADTAGNLLTFTSGSQVFNKEFDYVQGGKDLQDISFSDGYAFSQGVIMASLKDAMLNSILISGDIIYFTDPITNYLTGGFSPFHYSIIDFNDNPEGKLIVKKQAVSNDTLDGGQISMVRHANGKDWWFLTRKLYTTEHQKYLVTKDTVVLKNKQNIGLPTYPGLGQSAFSPNGAYFARYNTWGVTGTDLDLDTCGFYLYNFDRCTGTLSNPLHKRFPSPARVGGIAFSANSRFLYISHQKNIFQYDLQATDVLASEVEVATYDGFVDEISQLPTRFFMMALAPDDKIYINIPNFNLPYLHVIENPNEQGLACNIMQHAIKLPIYNHFSMPNMPNYKLGNLVGSPCDTITSAVKTIKFENLIIPKSSK
jgi:hypothetical protein